MRKNNLTIFIAEKNFIHDQFRKKNLNEMKILKIYDPDPNNSFTKAKVA